MLSFATNHCLTLLTISLQKKLQVNRIVRSVLHTEVILTGDAQLRSAVALLGQSRLVAARAGSFVGCVADHVQLFHLALGTNGCV